MVRNVVIAGGGHAGFQAAFTLRQNGYAGNLLIVDEETTSPYQRPPLSKAYMKGEITEDALAFKPEKYYVERNIERVLGRAAAINRNESHLLLESGRKLDYDHLILATGARNRTLDVPGNDLNGIFGLRTIADAKAVAARLPRTQSALVIGAGFIGLEFAVVAKAANIDVEVVELTSRIMSRAVSAPLSSLFNTALEREGINFHLGQKVTRILGRNGIATGVETDSGKRLDADLIVYGIGVIPNTEIASQAGLSCKDGVIVDRFMSTSDPDISAIGDCASFPNPSGDGHLRLESVQNATDQARCIAAKLLDKPVPYTATPWFWTEQGSLRLQIAGISAGYDQTVLLGDTDTHQYSILCFRQGKLAAVESTNRPLDHMIARRILSSTIAPSYEDACADGFTLKQWESSIKAATANHQ